MMRTSRERRRRNGTDHTPIDYGSPFDMAYGLTPDAVDALPPPLAATTAGLPPEPAIRRSFVGRALVIAAVIGIAALLAYMAAPSQQSVELPVRQAVSPASTPVVVLNTGTTPEELLDLSIRAEELGYPVTRVAGAPDVEVTETTVMYVGDNRAAARQVASELQIDAVSKLEGIDEAELENAQIAIILGAPGAGGQ